MEHQWNIYGISPHPRRTRAAVLPLSGRALTAGMAAEGAHGIPGQTRSTLKPTNMAKQNGMHPLKGTIDGFTYYYDKVTGHRVRRKGGPTRKQVKQSPAYELPRKNMTEFGKASSYGKKIRKGLRPLIKDCADKKVHKRFLARLLEIIKMDTLNEWGKRELQLSNLVHLRHYDLNIDTLSRLYFDLPIETRVEHGCLEVTAGVSLQKRPFRSDAWQLHSVAMRIDIITEKTVIDEKKSDIYEFEKGRFAESFTHEIPGDDILFHGMKIVWYRYDASIDDYIALKNEGVNAGFIRYVVG
jgi:hypothetical protein